MLSPPHLSIYQVTSHSTYSSSVLQSSQLASLLPSFLKSSSATPLAALSSEPSHGGQAADSRERREPGTQPALYLPSPVRLSDCRDARRAGGHTLCDSWVLFLAPPPLPSCPQPPSPPPFPPDPIGSSSLTFHSYTDDIQMCISIPISSCQ